MFGISNSFSDYFNYGFGKEKNNSNQVVVDFARQFAEKHYNETDGTADIFLGENGDSEETAWCAAFVEYCIENSGDSDIPDWYENLDSKWRCDDIYKAAEDAGALISSDELQEGDLVLFDIDKDGEQDHVGIFAGYDEDGKMITIEGNTNDGEVAEQKHDLDESTMSFCSMA